jgi:hypothetical protein
MKVSRKVGRRNHSSFSRRRLRNKKTKSGYRKKHTRQGGRRGRGHKRARTYKRGKRFHRGGVGDFDDDDIVSGSISGIQPTLLPETNIPTLGDNMLPETLRNTNKTKMPNALQFDYKRTDGIHKLGVGGNEPGLFDVVLLHRQNLTSEIILLRRSKSNPTEYDKQLSIYIAPFEKNHDLHEPFTGIQGSPIDNTSLLDGTYTLPTTDKNKKSFRAIYEAIENKKKNS